MLELSNITKIYQGGTVNETCLFDHFALKVPDGQFVCIVGSNGSGKTSLLNIICGSIPIEDGTVRIGGKNVTKMPEYRRHKIIGRVYQDPAKGTCPSMTILENMAMADNKGKPFNLGRCVNKKTDRPLPRYARSARARSGRQDGHQGRKPFRRSASGHGHADDHHDAHRVSHSG